MARKSAAWKSWLKSFVAAAIFIWAATTFFFSPKVVTRSSMEPNLFPGDLVLVSRFPLGPRMPVSIGIPFTRVRLNRASLPVWRVSYGGKLEADDVIVFNYPADSGVVDRKRIMVKRAVALPGDTIQLRNGNLFIGGVLSVPAHTILSNYEVQGSKGTFNKLYEWLDNYSQRTRLSLGDVHIINLSANEAAAADTLFPELQITRAAYAPGKYPGSMFPPIEGNNWSPDDYGPFYVPRQGDTIELDAINLQRYERLITHYEGNAISNVGDSIFVNGKHSERYIFKEDYYFVLGDNRHNSIDSRHWGPVPESHVIGRASRTLFSFDPLAPWYAKIRWSRLFQEVS